MPASTIVRKSPRRPASAYSAASASSEPHDRAERQQQRRGAREPEIEHEHGAERRAARRAEQPGLGERIAQQALQRGAAQAERSADEHGEQRPRQANLARR